MALDESSVHVLIYGIHTCDPGIFLTKEETETVLANLDQLEQAELANAHCDLRWFYMKIKANADYHGLAYELPVQWVHLYEGYRGDIALKQLPQPARFLAILSRSMGLRPSFITHPDLRLPWSQVRDRYI